MAETINKLSGDDDVAKSHHSDNRFDLKSFGEPPVLIITHKAYELALDRAAQRDAAEGDVIEAFMMYGGDRRKLVVIDEALDVYRVYG